jgi:aminoglycoside 2''-phosphotransferase
MSRELDAYLEMIKEIFSPAIAGVDVHESGYDFLVIEINSEWMFRFPRNERSQTILEYELKFLSRFNPISPLKIPDYKYIGNNYGGYPKIQGVPLIVKFYQGLSKENQENINQQLGAFLSAVHSFPIEEAEQIGIPKAWNGDHHRNGANFLEHVAPMLSPTARKKSTACMETLLVETFESKVIHGDLYFPDHVFADETSCELGVIDFADVNIYDPAHDFQCIVEIGGDEFFERVMHYYQGDIDLGLLKRSRMRLAARPLFTAGYIFANQKDEQYSDVLAHIEDNFG